MRTDSFQPYRTGWPKANPGGMSRMRLTDSSLTYLGVGFRPTLVRAG